MRASIVPVAADAVLPLRVGYRREMNCQIVHDSIHRRPGWTNTFALHDNGARVGFGSVAIGGPWTDKPTIFEFYVVPEHRGRVFDLFEAFLQASGARHIEIQSNDALVAAMLHTYARDIFTEAIVFRDGLTTTLPSNGGILRQVTPDADIRAAMAQRQGGSEWVLEVEGEPVAAGGILFHYNEPYGDVYMDVKEHMRRRGFGSYLVQELKRVAYELGSIPGARCSPSNIPSRKTLQKAGFVPYAHMLAGSLQ